MPSAPCPENPRFHPPSSHSSVADPSPWVVAALSPARLGQAVREVPSSRFALDGRGACLEGSRCDAGPSPRTAGGPSTSSKTSAPRYTTPCSGSIAATQDRDTTLDTVQLLSAPVSRRTVRAPDRRRVDVSTSAPPADRFISATSRPDRNRSPHSQGSSARVLRMARRRSGAGPGLTVPSTTWSRVGTPAPGCVRWLRARAPRTAVPSGCEGRSSRWSR